MGGGWEGEGGDGAGRRGGAGATWRAAQGGSAAAPAASPKRSLQEGGLCYNNNRVCVKGPQAGGCTKSTLQPWPCDCCRRLLLLLLPLLLLLLQGAAHHDAFFHSSFTAPPMPGPAAPMCNGRRSADSVGKTGTVNATHG